MSDDGRARRRTTAVVVALLLLVAALVVVTMRCGMSSDGDLSADGDGSSADESMRPAGGPSSVADGDERAGAEKTTSATKPVAPRRRRTPAAEEPPATTNANPAAPKSAPNAVDDAATRSPYGAFTLVGENGAHPGRWFGESVAIDGDVAVIAAPGFKKDVVSCGAAYVYERKNKVWTETQRLDSPRPDIGGFARRVGVAGDRIVAFGGAAVGSHAEVFRTYARGEDRKWNLEFETLLGAGLSWDAVLRGTTAAIVVDGDVEIWSLLNGRWNRTQTIKAPPGRSTARFGGCLSLAGDTLAECGDDDQTSGEAPVCLFRRSGGAYQLTKTLRVAGVEEVVFGALARNGDAFVFNGGKAGLEVAEFVSGGWTRESLAPKPWEPVVSFHNSHPFAADGDLVVIASNRVFDNALHGFNVLQRRTDGWYRTTMTPERRGGPSVGGNGPAWDPNVAFSGRTAVVSTIWDGERSGRAWFFDIADDDLARATKIASDAK